MGGIFEDLRPGAIFEGRYRLERPLGRGGFGAVYLATHIALGRKVAIKLLDLSLGDDQDSVERFRREGQAAAAIAHAGVVEVLDSETSEQGTPYLVMEYLEGPTLKEIIKREAPVGPAVAAAIVAPMLDALATAHSAGILHRDLKPANVILCTGPEVKVKLLDFGIAKFMDGRGNTRTGLQLGTPRYMPPEQAAGRKDLSPASDLYCVGVILFELLTGAAPFEEESEVAIIHKVMTTAAPPLTTRAQGLPVEVCRLVDSLLLKDPRARPQSASQVRAALLKAVVPSESSLRRVIGKAAAGRGAVRPTGERATPEPAATPTGPAPVIEAPRAMSRTLLAAAGALALAALTAVGLDLAGDPSPPTAQELAPKAIVPASPELELKRRNDKVLAEAQRHFEAGKLDQAEAAFGRCRVGDAPCPGVEQKLLLLQVERGYEKSLTEAALAIQEGQADRAAELLALTAGTQAHVLRRNALELELLTLREARARGTPRLTTPSRALSRDTPPAAGPAPYETGKDSPPTTPEEESVALAREAMRNSRYSEARGVLEKCIARNPRSAPCHKLLGSTYALLRDNKRGTEHYKKFLELDPNNPSADKVRAIIEAYESTQR